MDNTPEALLVLPRLKVHNANAVAAPQVWGFPSMTAFTGFAQALERKLPEHIDLKLEGVGVVCHDHQALVSGDYELSFSQQRSSGGTRDMRGSQGDRDGGLKNPPIVEEGRIHLELTVILEVVDGASLGDREASDLQQGLADTIATLRLAGGRIEPTSIRPEIHVLGSDPEKAQRLFRGVMRRSLPGSVLVHRPDLLEEALKRTDVDCEVDAWLDLFAMHWSPQVPAATDPAPGRQRVEWAASRTPGWVVPIPIGYASLVPAQEPGTIPGARSMNHEVVFVESLYSVGEWVGAHRVHFPAQLFWYITDEADPDTFCLANDFVTAGADQPENARS